LLNLLIVEKGSRHKCGEEGKVTDEIKGRCKERKKNGLVEGREGIFNGGRGEEAISILYIYIYIYI
jgi:hypothetical protein